MASRGGAGPRRDLKALREFRARKGQGVSAEVHDNGAAILARAENLKNFVANRRKQGGKANAKHTWQLAQQRLHEEGEKAERDLLRVMQQASDSGGSYAAEVQSLLQHKTELEAKQHAWATWLAEEAGAVCAMAKARPSPDANGTPDWRELQPVEEHLRALVQQQVMGLSATLKEQWEALRFEASRCNADLRAHWPSAVARDETPCLVDQSEANAALDKLGNEFPLVESEVREAVASQLRTIQDKHASLREGLERRRCSLWSGDRAATGGWGVSQHSKYVRLRACALATTAGGKGTAALLDALEPLLPERTRQELANHEDWYTRYRLIQDRQRALAESFAREHKALQTHARKLFESVNQEAAARADLAAAALSQQLECTRLQSKLEGLREGHRLRADVEAELLTRQEAARAAQAALQQAKEKAERDHQKQMIAAFKAEVAAAKAAEDEMNRLLEEEAALLAAEAAEYNAERVAFREDLYEMKLEAREAEAAKQLQAEREREERLAKIRAQVSTHVQDLFEDRVLQALQLSGRTVECSLVEHIGFFSMGPHQCFSIANACNIDDDTTFNWDDTGGQVEVNVENDPSRHLRPTQAHAGDYDASVRDDMFPVHGFTTDHLMKDKRFKVQLAMNEAGIKNPEIRNLALQSTAPYRPRPDMLTTPQLQGFRGNSKP